MLKSDIDLYIKEKRQVRFEALIDFTGLGVLIILGALLVADVRFHYQEEIMVGIAIGLALPKFFSSRKLLLEAFERQVNSDEEAVKYLASKNKI